MPSRRLPMSRPLWNLILRGQITPLPPLQAITIKHPFSARLDIPGLLALLKYVYLRCVHVTSTSFFQMQNDSDRLAVHNIVDTLLDQVYGANENTEGPNVRVLLAAYMKKT